MIRIRYSDDHDWGTIYSWLQSNCKDTFYTGVDWSNWISGEQNRIVQFESDQDALLFTLRWS